MLVHLASTIDASVQILSLVETKYDGILTLAQELDASTQPDIHVNRRVAESLSIRTRG